MVSIRGKRRRTSPATVDDGGVELRHEDLLRLIRMIGEVEDESEKSDASSQMEQTFVMIKPDGVQRGLIGEIIRRFENKSFTLKHLKLTKVDRSFAEQFYSDLSTTPFFNGLIKYIISGPSVAMVWEGKDVISMGRTIIGTANLTESDIGSVRGNFAIDLGRNVVHGSDSVQSAVKEIALWFPQ